MKLHNKRYNGKWFKVTSFKTLADCNKFLESNSDFGLLKIAETYNGDKVYIVAKNNDKGADKLRIVFESEYTGFCAKYYKADCGRLFVMIPEGLHTCNNDEWREPESPVDINLFELVEVA